MPAAMRWEYSIIDSADEAGITPPSHSGHPCVPEPSGPQPSPESETRTIPPIRIRTKVATIVAVTRRLKRPSSAAESIGLRIRARLVAVCGVGPAGHRRVSLGIGVRPRVGSSVGLLRTMSSGSAVGVSPSISGSGGGGGLERLGRDEGRLALADRLADVAERLGRADVGDGVEVVRWAGARARTTRASSPATGRARPGGRRCRSGRGSPAR